MKIKSFLFVSIFFVLSLNLGIGSDQIPAGPQTYPIAITDVTLHPLNTKVIENGTILFSNGRIVSLGSAVDLPANTKIFKMPGKHVYPGFIEALSRLGLTEISDVSSTNDYKELGQINPNVCAEVAVNPESEYFPVHRANGIALAVTAPTGGILSGKSALMRMDGWTWEEMTYKAPISMILTWPSLYVPHSSKKESEKRQENIYKNMALLNTTFENARAYMKAHTSNTKNNTIYHKVDLKLEALIPVLNGELPLWIKVNDLLDIEAAISWAKTQKIKIIIVGAASADLALDLLKGNNIPVIVTPVLKLPPRRDAAFDQPFTLPQKLYEAGIEFCIASGGASAVRNLPYHAAKAAAYGLPQEEALRSITVNVARILGVSDRLGTLETGKDATLIVADGDPLEITTQIVKLFIEGRDIDLGNKHKELYLKYQKRYEQSKKQE
jgi:imidazolonepropionase-like amidohydrolase